MQLKAASMSPLDIALFIAFALFVAVAFAVVARYAAARRREGRRAELRGHFGPEYDRAVADYGSEANAERELAARERRVRRFKIRALPESERERFATSWRHVQSRFVDDPARAVNEASELVESVMKVRGYPMQNFDHQVADLSVDHANVVQHYRAARALAEENRKGRADTEQLRQAFVHYRVLFGELLEVPQPEHIVHGQEAHA